MKSLLLTAAIVIASPALADETIQVAPFRSIELEGGGHVMLHHGPTQQVRIVRGSIQYTRFHIEEGDKLVIEACNHSCPQIYDLEIDITTPGIENLAISGGGAIVTDPSFPAQHTINAAVSGGGDIDLRSMRVENGNASVEGGGRIKINASKSLNASVEGGGDVKFWGNPRVNTNIEGGGDVSSGS